MFTVEFEIIEDVNEPKKKSLAVAPARNAIVSILPDGRVGAAGAGVDLLATQAVYTGLIEIGGEGANWAAVQIKGKLV